MEIAVAVATARVLAIIVAIIRLLAIVVAVAVVRWREAVAGTSPYHPQSLGPSLARVGDIHLHCYPQRLPAAAAVILIATITTTIATTAVALAAISTTAVATAKRRKRKGIMRKIVVIFFFLAVVTTPSCLVMLTYSPYHHRCPRLRVLPQPLQPPRLLPPPLALHHLLYDVTGGASQTQGLPQIPRARGI